jgi:hypothetical protein
VRSSDLGGLSQIGSSLGEGDEKKCSSKARVTEQGRCPSSDLGGLSQIGSSLGEGDENQGRFKARVA